VRLRREVSHSAGPFLHDSEVGVHHGYTPSSESRGHLLSAIFDSPSTLWGAEGSAG
jgi:hypothetical protein